MATLAAGDSLQQVAGVLHAAAILGPSAWRGESSPEGDLATHFEENLRKDLLDLFALLHARNVPYLLVGGVALLAYIDGRNTQDVDLVLSAISLNGIPEITVSDRNVNFARGQFGSVPVDVLFAGNPVFKRVQDAYATTHRFHETDVRCATVEGLILLKLYALPSLYRQGDGQRIGLYENDIFMLCERYRPQLEPLFEELKPFVDEDALRELRNIVMEIEQRIARVDRARPTKPPSP